jgi:hypothetical protein
MPNISDGRHCFVVTIDTHSFKGVGLTSKAAKTAAANYALSNHKLISTPEKSRTLSVAGRPLRKEQENKRNRFLFTQKNPIHSKSIKNVWKK